MLHREVTVQDGGFMKFAATLPNLRQLRHAEWRARRSRNAVRTARQKARLRQSELSRPPDLSLEPERWNFSAAAQTAPEIGHNRLAARAD
jgi:hypothetical protein